jgi:MYXO-CTERM domain-containing protein
MEAAPLPSSGQAGWLAMAAAAGLLVRRRRGR